MMSVEVRLRDGENPADNRRIADFSNGGFDESGLIGEQIYLHPRRQRSSDEAGAIERGGLCVCSTASAFALFAVLGLVFRFLNGFLLLLGF